LYDTQALAAAVQSAVSKNPDDITNSAIEDIINSTSFVRGFMTMKEPKPNLGNCHGASEVQGVAAIKGYGPLMYDIALGYTPALMADRASVSDQAASVWNYYVNQRSDVKKMKFDDIDDPQTPPETDDCLLSNKSELNYAIASTGANVDSLLNNHEKLVLQLVSFLENHNIFIDASEVTNQLEVAGSIFFQEKYNG
jgi:hypothetical protein